MTSRVPCATGATSCNRPASNATSSPSADHVDARVDEAQLAAAEFSGSRASRRGVEEDDERDLPARRVRPGVDDRAVDVRQVEAAPFVAKEVHPFALRQRQAEVAPDRLA